MTGDKRMQAIGADITPSRIRILVVEDSPVVCEFLTHILNLVPNFQVVGVAHDGEHAVAMAKECGPDIITMDIHMPRMDGFEATRRIMETCAKPIVIVSGSSTVNESVTACRALGAGALAVIARPYGFGHPEFASSTEKLVETLRTMADVKVVRRWAQRGPAPPNARPGGLAPPSALAPACHAPRLVAIGASTGGPAAIATILSALSRDMHFPIAVVQHICLGFTKAFCEWLGETTNMPVHVGTDGEQMLNGHVYVAPGEFHMGVCGLCRVKLDTAPPENGLKPSVAHLFRSVAAAFGDNAAAILLTGMGSDGSAELKLVRDQGGLTIAQDEASSVVHGMPGEAIRMNAAMHVLSPEAIGTVLRGMGRPSSIGTAQPWAADVAPDTNGATHAGFGSESC